MHRSYPAPANRMRPAVQHCRMWGLRASTGLAELHGDHGPVHHLAVRRRGWERAGRPSRRGAAGPRAAPASPRGRAGRAFLGARALCFRPPAELIAPVVRRLYHAVGHVGGGPRRTPPVQGAPHGTPTGHRPDPTAGQLERRAAAAAPPLREVYEPVSAWRREDLGRRAVRTRGRGDAALQRTSQSSA